MGGRIASSRGTPRALAPVEPTQLVDRTDEVWLAHLRGVGSEQDAALSDLRTALLRSLRRALSAHSRADEALLEDAVQDALIRILDRLSQFEGRSRFLTWATSIAIRSALTELRRRHWRDVSLDDLLAEGPRSDPAAADPDLGDERQAVIRAMYAVIRNELTHRQRTALLAELKGMPQVEIARQLGSTRNAIYKLTHDARRRLKRGLAAAGYGSEAVQAALSS